MSVGRTGAAGRVLIGRFSEDDELGAAAARLAEARDIRAGSVSIIGALKEFEYGFYDQAAGSYRRTVHRGEVEILHCTGNVSLKAGRPFCHLHLLAAGEDGRAFGGHLFAGRIFVAEYTLVEFLVEPLERRPASKGDLWLWPDEG